MRGPMMSFVAVIKSRPFPSLFIAIVLFLTAAMTMRTSGSCLKTPCAPIGIISFELAFTQKMSGAIKDEWDSKICIYGTTITSIAKRNIYQDFLFIPAYTLLLIVFVVIASTIKTQTDIPQLTLRFSNLAVIAGGCDIIENLFMLFYLNDIKVHPITFGFFAAIKFVIILLLIAFVLWSFIVKFFRSLAEKITKSA